MEQANRAFALGEWVRSGGFETLLDSAASLLYNRETHLVFSPFLF